ncbi:MAG TPA: hypothetical protein VIR33_07605 [Thermopolyspora sp.]
MSSPATSVPGAGQTVDGAIDATAGADGDEASNGGDGSGTAADGSTDGQGSAGGGDSGGSDGDLPVGSNKKTNQGHDSGDGQGTGGSEKTGDSGGQDDTGPQPDGAGGLIPPMQPDPGKGTGGPPYLNQTSSGV